MKLNSTEELIDDIKKGKMIIVMDDEDRENEGDFIVAAEFCTAEHVNFMAKHGRGLICLTLTEERCQQLNIPLMVRSSMDVHSTNFTVSIEASSGVTTGISAADRAKTIETAIRADAKPSDLTQPGHIFPLMAQPGGVLTRAGHTEAGCDFAKCASLKPAAAIVEILNDDGTMARRSDLEKIAQKFNLKIGTIADLIKFRVKNERTISRLASRKLEIQGTIFELITYTDSLSEATHFALTKGNVNSKNPVFVRVQTQSKFGDIGHLVDKSNRTYIDKIMQFISEKDAGVLVMLANYGRNGDILNLLEDSSIENSSKSSDNLVTNWRRIGTGSQILRDLGVQKMKVIGQKHKYHAISGFGLEVIEHIQLSKINENESN